MKTKNVILLGAIAFGLMTINAQAQTLFSNNFDSYTNGDLATIDPNITLGTMSAGYTSTISNALSASPNNSLKLSIPVGAGGESNTFFNFSQSITKDSVGFSVSFDFARGTVFNPDAWVMLGTGYAKGGFTIQQNGLNNFFDSNPATGFQWTGDNTGVFQNVTITYSNFTNDGSNITGWDESVVTSGGSSNPSVSYSVSGQSIASISSFRIQMKGAEGDFYVDNVNIVAIPEPTTWAMLLGGLGVVALLRRRRANS